MAGKGIKATLYSVVFKLARYATVVSPKLNTQIIYFLYNRRFWNAKNPITLNDKVLWLKHHTYHKNPTIIQCADKYRVRSYLKECGHDEILVPLLAAYEKPEDIEFDKLPDKFAMKLNVGCRCNIICADKSKLDYEQVREQFRVWMNENYYMSFAELQYKDVKPYILVEEYLGTENGDLPEDYKFYCFNGEAKYVMVCVDREIGKSAKFFYYDREWNKMPYTEDALKYPDYHVEKPAHIEEAFTYAERLSAPFPFVRTDLYIVNGKVYFGELTFTPSAGHDAERLKSTDVLLGEALKLPNK